MQTKEEHYRSMILAVQRYAPNADMDLIERAYRYADGKHKDQLRKSGEPYIIHPLAVAEIVAEIGLDSDAIAAALLHDCLEDTDASFEEISRLFGETIAELVEGVTKLTRVQYSTMEEQQMENLRKMFMAMSKDIRVILIKIADRLHNTRTLQYQTPAKQISKSMETMEIYAPLAHRLGMQKIKWELEDVSLQYLDPDGYQQIIDYLEKNEKSATSFMNAIQSKITERLASVGIHGSIYGRVKHTYSIYRKMRAQNKTIDELYDLYAFRVIVDNIADCYNVLGHIHDLFSPIPGRFKDYISTPKPNMYQSLHTTVIGSQHPVRGADPHMGDAPDGGIRRRGALEIQAAHRRRLGEGIRVGAQAAGKPAGRGRGRLYPFPQGRYVRRRGVRLYAQGQGHLPALRLHGHRLCLRHPFRRRQLHDRREGQ